MWSVCLVKSVETYVNYYLVETKSQFYGKFYIES